MLDILRDYIVAATTPEHYEVIERAHAFLERSGRNDFAPGFENILMTDQYIDTDTGETMAYIDLLTRELLREFLKNRSVVLIQPEKLSDLVDICEALLDIEDYEVAADVLNICNMDGTASEKLAEILSLVCLMDPDNIMAIVDEVSDSLIDRIREVFVPNDVQDSDQEIVEDPLVTASLSEFKTFIAFLGDDKLEAVDMIVKGVPIALEFKMYTDLLGREFENMDNIQAAREFIALAFLSSNARENPRQHIASVIESYIADFKTVTNITILVTDMLTRYQIFKTTEANRAVIEQINKGS